MARRPVILTGFNFTKTALAVLSEGYEIAGHMKALGPRGHVLNISRGWAVDEAALADALRHNVIEGAALDVYDEEPYEGQELLGLDNLVMTPHFGGGTEHAQRRMTSLVRRNLDAHFAGKPVVSPVPELRDMAAIPDGRLR